MPHSPSSPAFRLRLWLGLLAMLATLALGCITTTVGVQVTHPSNADPQGSVTVEFLQELDPQYAALAREANKDILAECAKSAVPCSENPKLPETLEEMLTQLGQGAPDMAELEESGFSRVEWAQGLRYRKTLPLQEYLDQQAKADSETSSETSSEMPRLEVRKDALTGNTHYALEITMGDEEEEGEQEEPVDWASWDAFRQEPDPPKPPIQFPSAEAAAEDDASEDDLFGDMGSLFDDDTKAESALQEWHFRRIMKQIGFPTLYRLSFILPGELASHTLNGQPAGRVIDDREVLFSIDEAFLRQHSMGERWVFRVESVVTPKMEKAARETKETQPIAATPASADPGQGTRRFRIRPLHSYALGLVGGGVYASYELQEVGPGGAPGRSCTIRFIGAGPMLSARFAPRWLVKDYAQTARGWVEFELNEKAAPMRLEDFDGLQGYHADAGAFIYRWSGLIFGARDSADAQVARARVAGPQAGLFLGGDSAKGVWKIVKPPH